jgi:hypothetical protein
MAGNQLQAGRTVFPPLQCLPVHFLFTGKENEAEGITYLQAPHFLGYKAMHFLPLPYSTAFFSLFKKTKQCNAQS